ncbi:hypothetical protein ACET3Z_028871 [Daucus carota]
MNSLIYITSIIAAGLAVAPVGLASIGVGVGRSKIENRIVKRVKLGDGSLLSGTAAIYPSSSVKIDAIGEPQWNRFKS